MTNGDKIFKAVIEDSALISYGGYNPDDCKQSKIGS